MIIGREDGIKDRELSLFLGAVLERYGIDFRDYASIDRRIRRFMQDEEIPSFSALRERVLESEECMERLLLTLFVRVTSMFRDPSFYLTLRREVVPLLRTYPYLRIWHAGCSTGEEVYSMAILLEEEGLYERCRIYATDINESVLKQARAGIFPIITMKINTANYLLAGGKSSFSDFYTARYDGALMRSSLKRNLTFASHNLATDGSFNEFHLILCRNVLIYFNRSLQERTHRLLYQSLVNLGFLGLGSKETIRFSPHEASYRPLNERDKLYKKTA
jgi:chemotaxis protein methyltransferase CheR